MQGLSTELYYRCRNTLLKCGEFDRDESLRAVFVTNELYPFRNGLTEGISKNQRVDTCLDFLLPKRLSDGRTILILFLKTLSERYGEGDSLHDELEELRSDIEKYIIISDTPNGIQQLVGRTVSNPYAARSMLTDTTMFFGREEELDNIFSRLITLQSYSIVGQRRIGKSSLLHYLCQPEVYHNRVPNPDKYIFAYLDLQTVGKPTRKRFFSLVLRKFAHASGRRLNVEHEPTYDGFLTFIEDSHETDWRLVLCLDEFEVICGRGEFDSDFFAFLRGLANSYNLSYITASGSVLHELCHIGQIASSQFWNIFTILHLESLKLEEARTLITTPFTRSGLQLSTEDIDFVLSLANCHPLFLQIACCHLFEVRKKGITDYTEVKARFHQEASPYVDYLRKSHQK